MGRCAALGLDACGCRSRRAAWLSRHKDDSSGKIVPWNRAGKGFLQPDKAASFGAEPGSFSNLIAAVRVFRHGARWSEPWKARGDDKHCLPKGPAKAHFTNWRFLRAERE